MKVKVKDKTEDVRETWETSQNPCVQAAEVLRVLCGHECHMLSLWGGQVGVPHVVRIRLGLRRE